MTTIGQLIDMASTSNPTALFRSEDADGARPSLTVADAGAFLERHGWLRAVAGPADFERAAMAVSRMHADRTRGLFLTGRVGCGKTMLAGIVYSRLVGQKTRIDCAVSESVDYLVSEADAAANGGSFCGSSDYALGGHVWLDDLGAEDFHTLYGNEFDRCGAFVSRWYARGRGRLIVTTNLDGANFRRRYGDRMVDRILERCEVVRFEGRTKRWGEGADALAAARAR